DILMRENIVSHHLPMVGAGNQGSGLEKGIDVWYALETYEIAQIKKLDIVVLVAGDSDYLPLIRKLHALSVRTMVLGFTFSFTADNGEERGTRVSQLLMNEASYPVNMSEFIENMDQLPEEERERYADLFVRRRENPSQEHAHEAVQNSATEPEELGENWKEGTIVNLLEGFGFIKPSDGGENLFFHHSALTTSDFADLFKGMEVSFVEGMGQRGICAIQVRTFY
ncbi:MAG TPA: cold shock domain-containing protein, partial [Anaerovoracaceae bacterium]|nr:cold shock domain-containing protein [Anaerovoracaceae bacterium]